MGLAGASEPLPNSQGYSWCDHKIHSHKLVMKREKKMVRNQSAFASILEDISPITRDKKSELPVPPTVAASSIYSWADPSSGRLSSNDVNQHADRLSDHSAVKEEQSR